MLLGRGMRVSFSKLSRTRASRPLFRLFFDTMGPQSVNGFCGELYTSILIDDCTRVAWHVNTRTKSAAGKWLPGQLRHLMARYGLPVVFLYTDNANKYSVSD